ncbi:phosphotransferase [Rhodovulum adriaticum]|uniref:Phosphotransferase family enzyme n=1 Tax=Rhodovulum adriaticum TaxID=35804 RepID=A0A4V2SL95_RHOAD|nr:phosphotransferase [Rhodovulum adriaticum]MBK1635779.1 hypothetical protein [Rhodovulum adriaticum]TCP22516.1 phosphotransferase family enzyme [Rhodovulum adriaticum]
MKLPEAVEENLSFLLAELDGQLALLGVYFRDPQTETAQRLVQRAGYAQNLSERVRKGCLTGMQRGKGGAARDLHLKGVDTIARNLETTARLARRAVRHAEDVERNKLLRADAYLTPVKLVRDTVARVPDALRSRDSHMAAGIGDTARLDAFYDRMFRTYTRDMRETRHTEDLSHALLTASAVHRMGEALRGIGEALLSINIGQTVQFERYFTLRSVLSGMAEDDADITLKPLAETRSGSAISGVRMAGGKGGTVDAVFKDGARKKVKQERVGVKSWNSVYPGLAPKILSYEKRGDSAALLIEHLNGETFEDIVLGGTDSELGAAQKALHKTLRDIWQRTRADTPAEMKAMEQLARRMPDVYRLHPSFAVGPQRIQGAGIESFDALVAAAARREAALPAPLSVWIHGDFNLDNVIYDPHEKKIRLIDLHRSCYMDYVQDVSVFMVSNYRLQVLDAATRARIAGVACAMHAMAAKFARSQGDTGFEFRLALGLARSFASSTRFVLDPGHASRMFLRSRYILERLLAVPEGGETRFKLPMRVLFDG